MSRFRDPEAGLDDGVTVSADEFMVKVEDIARARHGNTLPCGHSVKWSHLEKDVWSCIMCLKNTDRAI